MDNLLDIFLVIVSIVGIASASYVVAQTNVFRAALALALSFMTVAVVFFAINAEFLGAVQILVYIGAVSVLMAFSVLLVKDLQTASSSTVGTRFILSSVSSLLIFVVLVLVILGTDWNKTNQIENGDFRQALFEKYVIDEENKMIITNLDKNDNTYIFEDCLPELSASRKQDQAHADRKLLRDDVCQLSFPFSSS